jgi:long-chain fatty acid transport protein
MKKLLVFLCVAGLIAASASPLFAGGIENKTNWSAEYIRTLNRNAATDSADIVMYNPAGVMKMGDGFYGNLSVQYILKDYTNNIDGVDFDSDEPSFIPGLFLLYKQDRWAGFFGLSNVVGGGKVEFENGDATTYALGNLILQGLPPVGYSINSQELEGEHIGLGYTFGGAFKINDMFSVSLAAMYVDTNKEAKGNVTFTSPIPGVPDLPVNLDYEEDADGWGGVIGVNISPNDQWNIGIRYNTKVDLDYELTVNQDTLGLLTNGSESTRDLPAILALGVSYKLNDKIRLETNFTYYFNEDADWMGDEDFVDNGYDLGIALEYTFNPKLKGSIGYLHTDTGIDAEYMLPEAPQLNANTIGAGVAYEAIPGMMLNFSLGNAFYEDDSFSVVEYEKNNFFMAFGIQYKFM